MTDYWGIRVAALVAGALVVLAGCGDTPVATPTPDRTFSSTPVVSTPPPGTPPPSTPPPSTPPPSKPPQRKLLEVVQHGPRDKKQIALTFDADLTALMRKRLQRGTVKSYYNEALINELRQLKVPATLFLTGMWMEEYPDRTRQLAADPLFELGTHTYDHRGFTKHCYTLGTVPPADMLTDVQKAVDLLAGLDPHPTKWFRFPGGCYDGTALHELAPSGVTAVGLDVPGADGFAKSPTPIIKQVLSHVQNGSIVVLHMHGGDNAPFTDEAIPEIVRTLRARGYTLVTVSQLIRTANTH